jgi:hypothetical protein
MFSDRAYPDFCPLGVLSSSHAKSQLILRASEGMSQSRLSKAFDSTPETWLQMQLAYDLAAARKKEGKIKVRRQHIEEPQISRPS